MMSTTTAAGTSAPVSSTAAFVRPKFSAGQLLTEDDLELLTSYVASKNRFHSRMLFGPGVVAGLEVRCDPCGGGTVTVRPGYALDCAGNDIVVNCAETVSVTELVRDLQVSGRGADCGCGCDQPGSADPRRWGLYIRYAEQATDPIAPFVTEQPCPDTGPVASRIREGFQFLVKCPGKARSHAYDPGARLLRDLGAEDAAAFGMVWARGRRLNWYRARLAAAAAAVGKVIVFEPADGDRFTADLDELTTALRDAQAVEHAADTDRRLAELVRGLAASVARFFLYDAPGQDALTRRFPDLDRIGAAQTVLAAAADWLLEVFDAPAPDIGRTMAELTWPDPVQRGLAEAVVSEVRARLAAPDRASLQLRLLALGAPLDRALRTDLRTDLRSIRDWLLNRLDTTPPGTDCTLRAYVAAISLLPPLPKPAEGDAGDQLTEAELSHLGEDAEHVFTGLYRYVAEQACAALLPPAPDCTDLDVLLADVEVHDCAVVRSCAGGREQVLPGGSSYAGWLDLLAPARRLAEEICCAPVPRDKAVVDDDGLHLPYVDGWLRSGPERLALGQLLVLLGALPAVPAETAAPAAVPAPAPPPAGDGAAAAELSGQVQALSSRVDELRADVRAEADTLSQLRADVPDNLAGRLSEVESGLARLPGDEPAEPAEPATGGGAALAKATKAPAKKAAPRSRGSSGSTR